MAEDTTGASHGTPPNSGSISETFALVGASRDEADKFLRKQRELAEEQIVLARLQAEDLRREDSLRHWSLRVHHVSDVMKLAFEFAVAAILLAVVVLISAAVWNAAHDDGLVIEAFSVPPDMQARGLTGQAIAAQLQDKLTSMQDTTDSARPANSYANNWGNDIKVQIPDTGVSIGEFYRILVVWLGHQTHITGEVYRDANGISIVARASGSGGTVISGKESDFSQLMQQAAEAIFARTQPYRYAVYIFQQRQIEKARTRFEALTQEGSPRDRAWAWVGLASIAETSDFLLATANEHKAAALDPGFALPWEDLSGDEGNIGHDELALAATQKALPMLQSGDAGMTERARRISLAIQLSSVPFVLGDFSAAIHYAEEAAQLPDYSGIVEGSHEEIVEAQAMRHDPAAFLGADRTLPESRDTNVLRNRASADMFAYYWLRDWPSMIVRRPGLEKLDRALLAIPGFTQVIVDQLLTRQDWPYIATALAMTGDFAGAHALIDKTPLDCYACLRNRGDIDAAEGNWRGAGYWFTRAVAAAPSIPMAYTDWGQMLLAKGDAGGAIAKFTLANTKGPHYADPLEMWGEALIRENRSDLALAKFAEAAKDAPNWGRLHLKWGEALHWSGKKDDARKQFALASSLDLNPSEKTELARMRSAHG